VVTGEFPGDPKSLNKYSRELEKAWLIGFVRNPGHGVGKEERCKEVVEDKEKKEGGKGGRVKRKEDRVTKRRRRRGRKTGGEKGRRRGGWSKDYLVHPPSPAPLPFPHPLLPISLPAPQETSGRSGIQIGKYCKDLRQWEMELQRLNQRN
jgi:hypothetical protein